METDATLGEDEAADRRAMSDLLGAVTSFLSGVAPMVETPANPAGVIPLDTAKALLLAAVRRFRLGREVEDALDAIGQAGPARSAAAAPPPQALEWAGSEA